MTESSHAAWLDKATGEIAIIFHSEFPPEGYSAETHDLVEPLPDEMFDGKHNWDASTRTVVVAAPASVTPLQMRKALRAQGLMPQVKDYFKTASEEVIEAWEYAVTVDYSDKDVTVMLTAIGANKDEMFLLAGAL